MNTDGRTLACSDDNIDDLRAKYPNGLHFVVGDTHGEAATLKALMSKIRFDPDKDHIFFVGDYNEGGNVDDLMDYLSLYYRADYAQPGFHLIRGNHEREFYPVYPLENLPDIIVIRGKYLRYFIVHAGMVSKAFDLINEDMAKHPRKTVFAYRLDGRCAEYDAPLRQIVWSRKGLYSQKSRWHNWPSEPDLFQNRACIIHGHSPYCFFVQEHFPQSLFEKKSHTGYGDNNLFWPNQHIWFSEDLQSFNIDANVKGRYHNGEGYRGLACVCLDVLEDIAFQNDGRLTVNGVQNASNCVFAARYTQNWSVPRDGDIRRITKAQPEMKTITLDTNGDPVIIDQGC